MPKSAKGALIFIDNGRTIEQRLSQPMSISAHCFYSIPCVKSKMELSPNCTGWDTVIGPMPAFRRCRKLRPFGFSAALKHFLLRPGIAQTLYPTAAAARVYGVTTP